MNDLKCIGLVAVSREAQPLLDRFPDWGRDRQGEARLHMTETGRHRLVLAEVLPGPVNAALGAQALIARHGAGCLIGFGSAGTLEPSLVPGQVVVARQAAAHDAGAFLGSRFEPVGIKGRDDEDRVGYRRAFQADADLVAAALAASRGLGLPVQAGMVVTGNQVIFSSARRRWLHQTFEALAVDMETAAVAQVAVAHGLPWVAVRAISDEASDALIFDYGRLRRYLDDDRPEWRQRLERWWFLLTIPGAWRWLRGLRQGLDQASILAARVVSAMLDGARSEGSEAWGVDCDPRQASHQ